MAHIDEFYYLLSEDEANTMNIICKGTIDKKDIDRLLLKGIIKELKSTYFLEFENKTIEDIEILGIDDDLKFQMKVRKREESMKKTDVEVTLEPDEIKAMFRECLRERLSTEYDLNMDDINERGMDYIQTEGDGSIRVTFHLDPVVKTP